jgi:hypothetical protein
MNLKVPLINYLTIKPPFLDNDAMVNRRSPHFSNRIRMIKDAEDYYSNKWEAIL